ncbi:hypothetical protein Tco_1278561, partial [Tanacetum coccineum]
TGCDRLVSVGIKSLLSVVEVTAASYEVTTALVIVSTTGRKANLLEDKQILSVGAFDEIIVAVVVRDFYKKFYNSLGKVHNHWSSSIGIVISSVGSFEYAFVIKLLGCSNNITDESLYYLGPCFKEINRKVSNHSLNIWTLIEIFLKHLDSLSRHIINLTAEGDLRKFSDIGAWVQVPMCMAWLDYDEHEDSLSTMDNEVGVTSPENTTQTLPSFEEYTPPVTYPEEVEETLGILMEVEPLDKPQLVDLGLNTCNHDIALSSKEIPSVDEPEPQLLPNSSPLDVILGDKRGTDPPINPCIPGLLGQSGSLGVDLLKLETIEDDWELGFKEVSFLGRGFGSPVKPKEVEKVIFDEKKLENS